MKLPIDAESYVEAVNYAMLSVGKHTHFHHGWDYNLDKQYQRILSGQVAQNYLMRLLRANGVAVETDGSDFTESDKFDFKIRGYSFDVKSSSHSSMPMQVTLPTKRKKPDYFVFCRLGVDLKTIEIVGVVRASDVFQEKFFVKKGESIPHTHFKQTFEEGSYFYTGQYKSVSNLVSWAVKSQMPYGRHTPHGNN